MSVLVVTRANDEYATGPVLEALAARGVPCFVLETDRAPGHVGFTWSGPGEGWLDLPGQGRLDLGDLSAVWMRRMQFDADLDPHIRAPAMQEVQHLFLGMLHDTEAFIVDPLPVYTRARCKALQLDLARAVGLQVPPTLQTNDPDLARAFVAEAPGGVISKMYGDHRLRGGTVFTNVLGPDDVEALDSVALCPTILQHAVEKHSEVRAVVLGDRVFAVELETSSLPGSEVDWRRHGADTLHLWRPVELPDAVRAALLRLHDALHTHHGSADFIVEPDGRYVFLENNVVGESFWLAEHHPIGEAWADLLTGGPVRSVPRSLGGRG